MNKAQIKKIIQEKLQMIETLQSHVRALNELIDDEVVLPHTKHTTGANNVAQQIEAYRQKVMQSVQTSLSSAGNMGVPPVMGGMPGGMPSGMPDMKRHFEDIRKEMEKKVKE